MKIFFSNFNFLNIFIKKIKNFIKDYLFPKSIWYKKKINGKISFSQAFQDNFVLEIHKFKKNGFYIEVGSSDPIGHNNSYILEKYYKWLGLSFEIEPRYVSSFNFKRKNRCILADATTFNFEEKFNSLNVPKRIDYLQIDIDPSFNSLKALERMPLSSYRFSVITFEHDRYTSGDDVMLKSRKILESYGYKIFAENVMSNGSDFEDWWIDSSFFDFDDLPKFSNIESKVIVKELSYFSR